MVLNNIPANVTLAVSEENSTDATYIVTIDDSNLTLLNGGKLAIGGTEGFAATQIATIADGAATKQLTDKIIFTNTQENISPTGLLFRVAPFALMMTAGGVLIAVYLRGKKREDAESMI